jgi:hypothetical protein
MRRGEDAMDDSVMVEPFRFFSLDALRAGWYLLWRQLIRFLPAVIAAVLLGVLLYSLGLGVLAPIVSGIGVLAAIIWAAVLTARLTIQWAEQWYGATLTGQVQVWWGVTWRTMVASLVAAVILTPPNFVAMSLKTAFPGSALGLLGNLLAFLLGVANFGVTLLATGWAMSKVAAEQITTHSLDSIVVLPESEPEPSPAAVGLMEPEPVAAPVAVAAPPPVRVAAPVAAPPVARPTPVQTVARPVAAPAAASGKTQCPKCGLYETEQGKVIGLYCRICGWRAGR